MINCPICHKSVKLEEHAASCISGHTFPTKNGVYQLLTPDYRVKLEQFLSAFEDFRKGYIKKMSRVDLKKLPYINEVHNDRRQWKAKRMDLDLIKQLLLGKNSCKVLELGAWNGWLSNRLVGMGHNLVAVDLFIHELDGLGAKKHYEREWTALQLDLNELSIIKEGYDFIIVNRSLAYFSDIDKTLSNLKAKLNPGGILLITGINYRIDYTRLIENYEKTEKVFNEKYETTYTFFSSKGYIDSEDIDTLKKQGVRLSLYKARTLRSYFNFLFNKGARNYYGIYQSLDDGQTE